MNAVKMNLKEIIFCIVELVIGILLLINPVSFTAGIIVLCGVSMLATGILFGFKYFRMTPEEAKDEVFQKYYNSLANNGVLFIGSTEQILRYTPLWRL